MPPHHPGHTLPAPICLQGQQQGCINDPLRREELRAGQAPRAVVLTCADSRCPPELIFDMVDGMEWDGVGWGGTGWRVGMATDLHSLPPAAPRSSSLTWVGALEWGGQWEGVRLGTSKAVFVSSRLLAPQGSQQGGHGARQHTSAHYTPQHGTHTMVPRPLSAAPLAGRQGFGDLFVIRVAGNIVSDHVMGRWVRPREGRGGGCFHRAVRPAIKRG